ncbi:MAG: helix-turn-helix domain-containing protein [Acidimicrobiia bacterium]|nr:helix-turn-helix domain-containing protein [Acidimicrobiia bacterium]
MAQRLCFDERTRIEAMCEAQLSVAVIAERLGRDRSAVHREVERGGGRGGSSRSRRWLVAWPRRSEARVQGPDALRLVVC